MLGGVGCDWLGKLRRAGQAVMGGASHGGRGGLRLAGQVAMGKASPSGMRSHGSVAADYLEWASV